MLQPEQDTLGQSSKTTAQETPETAYMSGFPHRAVSIRKALA
jgi:hypothetical protein